MAFFWKNIPPLEARAAMAAMGVSAGLMGLKFIAYYITSSSAIFSDAMESVVNVIGSGVAFYSLVVAHRPADVEHPYGHGKVEFMSAGFEGGMILLASVVMVWQTIGNLVFHRMELHAVMFGIVMLAIAMGANGAAGIYLMQLGKKSSSMALEGGGKHLLSDAITSVAALMTLLIVRKTGWTYADPIGALLMAAYIAWMGLRLMRQAAAGLMDEQDVKDEKLLKKILDAHVGPGDGARICSYHKLRHRHSGRYHWVDFHIMVPGKLNVAQGHEIASAIEWEIEKALGEGNATGHVEPCGGCVSCASVKSEGEG